jgi:hypothetical protein
MGLVDDLTLIGGKIDELIAANAEMKASLSFNPIQAGNDYSVIVTLPNGIPQTFSSIDVNDVVDFLDGIIANI